MELTGEMKKMERLAKAITNYCLKNELIEEGKSEIYLYGFKLIIADIINYAIVILLGMLFGEVLESAVFLICLCGLRQFSGGFHAKSFWLCRLSMIVTFLLVVIISDAVWKTDVSAAMAILINVCSVLAISIFAPIENINKPMTDEQRHSNKIKSILTSIFLSCISIVLMMCDIKSGVTISITLLAVVVLMIIGMAMKKGGKEND